MKSLSPGLHTKRAGLCIHAAAASMLRFVILAMLLALPSGAVGAIEAESGVLLT